MAEQRQQAAKLECGGGEEFVNDVVFSLVLYKNHELRIISNLNRFISLEEKLLCFFQAHQTLIQNNLRVEITSLFNAAVGKGDHLKLSPTSSPQTVLAIGMESGSFTSFFTNVARLFALRYLPGHLKRGQWSFLQRKK